MSMPGGPPPPPPVRPNPYIPDDWEACIINVGGATISGSVSSTSVVYETSQGYHFTLQPQWKDPKKRNIVQPHITIQVGTNQHHVYIAEFETTPSRLAGNAAGTQVFIAQGIANPSGLLQNFCVSLTAKLQSFNACRDYDNAVAQYRKNYPWTTIVKMWTGQQNATRASLVVRSRSADIIVLVSQTGAAPPCVLTIKELNDGIQEPSSPPGNAFTYLSERFCVILVDGGAKYQTVAKVEANRNEAKFGKNSPERKALERNKWAASIVAEADAEIITLIDTNVVPGNLKNNALIFWIDSSCLQADVTAEGCLKRNDFKSKVTGQIYGEITLWVPQAEPGDAEFQEQARTAVRQASKSCYIVRQGAEIWVIPRSVTKKKQPTDEERRLGLDRYYLIGPYQPLGQDTGEVILRLGTQHWHTRKDALTPVGSNEDRDPDRHIVLVRDGILSGPFSLPAGLVVFDLARYQWINGLPKANMALCGAVTLIALPGEECIIVLDDDAQYSAGGACFAVTGTPGCLCFTHPVSQQLAIVDPARVAKVKIVRSLFTLGGRQGFVVVNAAGQLAVCPAGPVGAVTADTIVVEADGVLIGLASLDTLALLDMATLIAAGHLSGQVTVSFDGGLSCYITVDHITGGVTWYEFKGFFIAPLLAADNAVIKLLTEVTAGSGGFTAAVDAAAGYQMVLGAGTIWWQTPAVLLARLSSGKCVISYDAANPAWENSAVVQLVPVFQSSCDLLVTNADGTFAGYAHSASAEGVATVLAPLVPPYTGGSHRRLWAYPFSGTSGPDESRYVEADVIVPADAVTSEPFTVTVIHMALSLPECLTLHAANSLYVTVSSVTNSPAFCTLSTDPSSAFVVPQGVTLAHALAWQDPGYDADDEVDGMSDDETDETDETDEDDR